MESQTISAVRMYIVILVIAVTGGIAWGTLARDVVAQGTQVDKNTLAAEKIGIVQTEIKYIRESITDMKTQQRIDKADILRAIANK